MCFGRLSVLAMAFITIGLLWTVLKVIPAHRMGMGMKADGDEVRIEELLPLSLHTTLAEP